MKKLKLKNKLWLADNEIQQGKSCQIWAIHHTHTVVCLLIFTVFLQYSVYGCDSYHFGFFMPSWWMTSLRTLMLAVAVRAIIGIPGYFCFRIPSFL